MNQLRITNRTNFRLGRLRLRLWPALGMGLFLVLHMAQPAAAAEFAGAAEVYILPQDSVIADDLYVSAPEVIINGTVEGDLLVTGAYVEINGVVNGSVMAAAAGVQINGVVQNSVRAAGMSVVLNGTVRKDFIAAAGGGPGFGTFAMPVGTRRLTPGLQLTRNSSVSGDAVLTGGSGRLAGVIGGDLLATINQLEFGGTTRGAAHIQAGNLQVQENARVEGVLTYTGPAVGPDSAPLDGDVAGEVVIVPPAQEETTRAESGSNVGSNLFLRGLAWLWQLAIQIIGLGIIAWLVWTFFPTLLLRPTTALETRPVESGLYGLVALVALIPLAFALIFLGALFWGFFPGGVSFATAAFGLLSVGWLLSPVFVGLWVGRRLINSIGLDADSPLRGDLPTLLLGTLSLVVLASVVGLVPCLGPIAERIIYMLSLALVIGGLLITRLRPAPAVAEPA
ncbi:MAG: polymer-forming cytoskeletal protein [Litorilinea sp.]